jgi:predicted RNA-binding Zn-ribbon protein involved in translation (DUF1610 family)
MANENQFREDTKMIRLIDANEIEELFYKQVEYGATDLMDAFDDALQDAQTVDAVEVVHGRCVYVRDEELIDHWECSVCGRYIPWEYHLDWSYCPNCGAHMMDGDGNG